MAGEWFVAREGQQPSGPVTPQQLKQMATSGQLQPEDLVWREGMPKWVPAGQVKGLLGAPPTEPPAAPPRAAEPSGVQLSPGPAGGAEEAPFAPAEAEGRAGRAREPWYYRFLEKYALIALWLGVAVCGLGYLVFLATSLASAVTMFRLTPFFAVLMLLLSLVGGTLMLALALLAVVFQVALILLAVDAARNLRELRRKLPGD
jgi:hypothetical protein